MEGVHYQQQLKDGINLYLIKEPKFKTVSLNVFMYRPLDGNTTKNALLPHVLKRGCEGLPDIQAIETFLGERYGASLDVNVVKKGDMQLLHFNSSVISNKYTLKGEGVVGEVLDFLLRLVTAPLTSGGGFREDYFNQEKENLRKLIRARINDKINYSVDRCYEELCQGQPFSRYIYGREEDLEGIDRENLYRYYREMLEKVPVDIFVVGDADEGDIDRILNRPLKIGRGNVSYPRQQKSVPGDNGPREVIERMDINQGKLTMGYTTGVAYGDPDYIPMLVCGSVLGGGPHSKLFNNVREKASLAYYTFARLEKFKGLMLIGSGIEISNYRKAREIIDRQLEDMVRGNIGEYEMEGAKKSLINGILSMKDSQMQMVDFLINKKISGHRMNTDCLISGIEETTVEQVSEMAGRIKPGVVYFLTSIEKTEGRK